MFIQKLLVCLTLVLLFLSSNASAQLMSYDVVLEGDINSDMTLTNSNKYLLRGVVNVNEGATLTIEPGTLIFGEPTNQDLPGPIFVGTLVINRGAKIMAEGTPELPIVFTSARPIGARNLGDWGGLIIAGRASNNAEGGTAVIEGGTETIHGGGANPDDDDDSGVLRYVRIEFGGAEFAPDNEINGLSMGSVGRGTTIEYVQVSYNDDDAFEWWGGTVDARYLIALGALDDDLDTDNGFHGRIQHALVIRHPQLSDISSSNGFESDGNPTGSLAEPRTAPVFSNVTFIGPLGHGDEEIGEFYRRNAHIRRSSQLSVFNSILMGWPTGILFDGVNTVDAALAGNLEVRNTIVTGPITSTVESFDAETWFLTSEYGNTHIPDANDVDQVGLTNPFLFGLDDLSEFDPRPITSLTADFSSQKLDDFFDVVDYAGAFAPGGERWDLPWANYDPWNYDYEGYTVGIGRVVEIPHTITLGQNYPNPFNPSTRIAFTLAVPQTVRLTVHDVLGRQVAVLAEGVRAGGTHTVDFDAAHLSSGIYVYRIETEKGMLSRTMTLLR